MQQKPTRRRPRTQHPYTSQYIGPPHVIDVDIENLAEVQKVLNKIANQPPVSIMETSLIKICIKLK